MNIKSKSKGFTLMELIVVIVILALLILMAGPQILKLMEQNKQGTFRNDVQEMVKTAENAFTTKSLKPNSGIKIVNGRKYLCMSLEQLKSEGFLNKELNDSSDNPLWMGWIEISVPTGNGETTYTLTVTNGEYYLQEVASNKVDATDLTSTTSIHRPSNCPTVSSYGDVGK